MLSSPPRFHTSSEVQLLKVIPPTNNEYDQHRFAVTPIATNAIPCWETRNRPLSHPAY